MKVKILYYPGQIHRGKGLTAGLQKAWHQLYYVPWKTRRHRSAFPKCKTWHRAQCEILNTANRTGSAHAVEGFQAFKESGHPTAAAAAFKMFTRMHILRNCMEFKQFFAPLSTHFKFHLCTNFLKYSGVISVCHCGPATVELKDGPSL